MKPQEKPKEEEQVTDNRSWTISEIPSLVIEVETTKHDTRTRTSLQSKSVNIQEALAGLQELVKIQKELQGK